MTAQTDLALAASIGAALDEIEQNDGAGALIATRTLIRPIRQGSDPLRSETLTIRVYQRCAEIALAEFGTCPTGLFGMIAARDEAEIPLHPGCDYELVTARLVKKYTAIGWAQVPA